jgi:uncharacterized SAM-binding protein YcdF (DUF218 family)
MRVVRSSVGRIVVLALVLGIGGLAWSFSTVSARSTQDAPRRADAIIVLGAAEWNGRPSPALRGRLDHALQLYNEGYAPRIITTGGQGSGSAWTEAAAGKAYLEARGVPSSAVLTEDASTSSVENLRNARQIMEEAGLRSAILVSDPYHMARVLMIAADQGIPAEGSPTRAPFEGRARGSDLFYTVRETLALAFYVVFRA